MPAGDPPPIREGDSAFAVQVQTIFDLLEGLYDMAVRLTRHSSPTVATLRLANRTIGGPILEILAMNLDGSFDEANPVLVVRDTGADVMRVGGFFDWTYQAVAPAAPGAGTGLLRMYARAGQLYFKAEDGAELQIPLGPPPGPTKRREYWYSGG